MHWRTVNYQLSTMLFITLSRLGGHFVQNIVFKQEVIYNFERVSLSRDGEHINTSLYNIR